MIQVNILGEEIDRAKVWEGVRHFSTFFRCLSPSSSMRLPTQKLSKPYTLRIFVEVSSHRHNQSLTPFPVPFVLWRMGERVENSNLLIIS